MNTFHFILKYNFFIAFIAAAMALETSIVCNLTFIHWQAIGCIFFTTLCTYNAYYIKNTMYKWSFLITILSGILALLFFYYSYIFFRLQILIIVILCSGLYFLPAKENRALLWIRLLLLTLIWYWTTTELIMQVHTPSDFNLYRLYRLCLLFFSCTHFVIKDSDDRSIIAFAKKTNQVVLVLLILISVMFYSYSIVSMLKMMAVSCIAIYLNCFFNVHEKKPNDYYLFFMDGILLLLPLINLFYFVYFH